MELFQDRERYHLIASGITSRSYAGFEFKKADPDVVWQKFENGDIFLSEPFAYRNNLDVGAVLSLRTDTGRRDFRVAGIYPGYQMSKSSPAMALREE